MQGRSLQGEMRIEQTVVQNVGVKFLQYHIIGASSVHISSACPTEVGAQIIR